MKLTCLIVDDEPLARQAIQNHIKSIDALEVVGVYENAVDAFLALPQQPVDLVFLDIQMPKMTGLEFLKSLKSPPKVIITTAYREYALDGFELDVVDYLVKPIAFERFLKAVGKVLGQMGMSPRPPELQTSPQPTASPFIYVKIDKMMEKVLLRDILYLQGLRNYINLNTRQGKLIVYSTMSHMQERLPEKHFLRIHRSYIVAIDKIQRFTSTHVEIGDNSLPIGGSYKDIALQVLSRFVV